jgi:hypothetical protein
LAIWPAGACEPNKAATAAITSALAQRVEIPGPDFTKNPLSPMSSSAPRERFTSYENLPEKIEKRLRKRFRLP